MPSASSSADACTASGSWLIVILFLFVPKYLRSMQNVKYPYHTLGFILCGFHNMEQ